MNHREISALVLALLFGALPVRCISATDADEDETRVDELRVTAARLQRLVRDEPLRVEALPSEEIEENGTVSPGTLTSLLEELPGVQFQASAAGLGGTGLRLRGLPSRLTQVRVDGLPLLGAAPESFGVLQVPPLDLGRVEVIKGAASSLYGSGPLGGVLNLVSRPPGAESTLLANLTHQAGQDLVSYLVSEQPGRLAGSLLAGLHRQDRRDLDHDGWAEVPGYKRAVLRPRLWWTGGEDGLFATAGFVRESREGGSLRGGLPPAYRLTLDTEREDVGATAHGVVSEGMNWHVAASWAKAHIDQVAGAYQSRYDRELVAGESWLEGTSGRHIWLMGLGWQSQSFAVQRRPELSRRDAAAALFVQDEWTVLTALRASTSLRVDNYADQGRPVSGRVALLWQPQAGSGFSLRASAGRGFSLPTLMLDDIESVGPAVLMAGPPLNAERGDTVALDLHWTGGDLEVDLGAFESRLRDRLGVDASGSVVRVVNLPGKIRIPGAEFVARYAEGPLHVIGNWTWLDPQGFERVPQQAGELAILLEKPGRGRVGIEFGYTGRQAVSPDPTQATAPGFLQTGLLAALRVGRASWFLNLENLTDVRQDRYGRLRTAVPGIGGLPVREAWAPLEGRRVNLGVKIEL